jgi:tripartite ATP-independent transporter DctM subunit
MADSLIGFAVLLAICFVGVPMGFALVAVGFFGFGLERSFPAAFATVGQQVQDVATNYGFSVLPLFLLMGTFIHRAALSEDLYDASNAWLGHLRGGLAMATITACGGLAAVSGSSLATAATMGKIAIPSMRRYNYADSLAGGAVAVGGTLGILIPPSVPMVIYGILTQGDIGKLFIAGVLPGVMMVALLMMVVGLLTRIRPNLGPPGVKQSWEVRLRALANVWGVLLLFAIVIGGMYTGVFTPTEAAGIGAAGAFLFALFRRRLTWATFVAALVEAGETTCVILVVTLGALIFSNFLDLSGLPAALADWINSLQLGPVPVILAMCGIYVILGCLFDSLAMLILTVPVFYPITQSLGIDPIWFGIIVIIVVEIGLITPPVGMNVFIIKGMFKEMSIWTIFAGVTPFLVAQFLGLGLIIAFPAIALMLPRLM